MQMATQEGEWIDVVSARLKRQWPTIDADEPLTEVAGVLWSQWPLNFAMSGRQTAYLFDGPSMSHG